MSITTLTSSEFNKDVSRAKKASKSGPVIITNRNKPTHVFLCIEEYERLKGDRTNLIDILSMPGLAEIEFEPPHLRVESSRTAFR